MLPGAREPVPSKSASATKTTAKVKTAATLEARPASPAKAPLPNGQKDKAASAAKAPAPKGSKDELRAALVAQKKQQQATLLQGGKSGPQAKVVQGSAAISSGAAPRTRARTAGSPSSFCDSIGHERN